ncbi:hypothetical protein [Methylobacterium aquaticum]|uniref:Uncharacterized protein n=1 Tax=Methylobacterium aquaticum TaxID=270351 RepID=A0A0C6FPU1_9HYPH|nr:hypothetical protein [Methylobacterium aquaticum]BAQ50298.1 hypothetical protein Maq22A_3p50235 [Methylobacterium aquaticum]
MSTPFHTQLHVHGIKNELFNRSMNFRLPNGLTKADVESRLVEPDPTSPVTMKLLSDGAKITAKVARLEVYEDRQMITAQFRFSDLVPILKDDPLAVGDVPVGAGNGFVKKGLATDEAEAFVAEIVTRKGVKYAALVKL